MVGFTIDGKSLAFQSRQIIKEELLSWKRKGYQAPGLAVIQVGQDAASSIYVRHKRQACTEVGIVSYTYDLPDQTSEDDLLSLIRKLNQMKNIDGILVQLPLSRHINTDAVIRCIDPKKDVDGFHPFNLGRLAQGEPSFRPCTPWGIIRLLSHHQISLRGKHAVVIGASNIVGKPMALELLLAGATVTICHRATIDLHRHVSMADIVIVATGVQDVLHTDWLHAKQVIIDVGIHRSECGSIRGDVDFNQVREKVAWITPVPGGVGPMTIDSLLQNTVLAAQYFRKI